MKGKAVVLVSGGMDSTTLLTDVLTMVWDAHPLYIVYGSRQQPREVRAARQVIENLGARELEIVTLSDQVFRGSDSALMDSDAEVPSGEYRDWGPQPTEVPFRNGLFLSIAAARARVHGATAIFIANHADDVTDYAYPDCSKEFMDAMEEAIDIATMGKVRLIAPYVELTKAGIVEGSKSLNPPLHLSYSCYTGDRVHCGTCATCRDRRAAFEEAGVADPTVYKEVS